MDPDETLRILRALLGGDHSGCEDWKEAEQMPDDWGNDWLATLCRAEEAFQALDQWMSCNGHLPKDWRVR